MPIILILLGLIGLFVLFPPIIFVYLIVAGIVWRN
jgi:hypothetical protein